MFVKFLIIVFFSFLSQSHNSSSQILEFIYNSFHPPLTNISIQGIVTVTSNGILKLSNTSMQRTGHAFYTKPIWLKDSPNGNVYTSFLD
ncbi:hypothetical protein ARALYDRAFT_891427 [Arabidopsis lyrata subsp. lyrata]|uniref:Legume lectin domain-containing protein n=1 Tax=Arabidopsis lyrata subsp. lyrata TaxID=81972 RepID=D7KPR2_ARALL|nr:hypothetical protein ARALYDRAFT_891427 [Arabidopsis lyrata subsp. lyrata]